MFLIVMQLLARGAASADDTNSVALSGSVKHTKQQTRRPRVAENDRPRLVGGVIFILENPRQGIAEHGSRLGKAHAVLQEIGSRRLGVPFEHQGHRVSLLE